MTDKIQLKPCPFCGGKVHLIDKEVDGILNEGKYVYNIRCCRFYSNDFCLGSTIENWTEDEEECIKLWNSRGKETCGIDQNDLDDFYIGYENQLGRLKKEFDRYGKIIIAYDYDGTIHDFHGDGFTFTKVIQLLKDFRKYASFICFTASNESRYDGILSYLEENEIPIDTLNESIKGTPEGRKVYYNILLDDRSGLGETYRLLVDLLDYIQNK